MSRALRVARGLMATGIVSIAACRSAAPPRKSAATPVRVVAAHSIDAPVTVMASGVVEPMQTVAVTAQVSGSLLNVLFTEGQFVQKGQPMFQIDPRPLQAAVDQANATLARDQAQADAARRDDMRFRSLADIGYVSRSQADQQHATALAQDATVQADMAALRAARVNLGFALIRAPIAGRTGGLLVRRGNNVSPGSGPLVVINQLKPVLVRFPVLAEDFSAIQMAVAAHPLPVTATSSDTTQVSEHGQLTFLDNTVDSLTGAVTGKANFDNDAGRMWPGELVFLTIQLRVERGVVAVPTNAILTGQQGSYVFVVDGTNTARMRAVQPSYEVSDLTVVQKGLAVGERVVVDGQSRLNPGSKVALIPAGTDTGTAGALTGMDTSGISGPTSGGKIVAGRAGEAGSAATNGSGGGAAAGTVGTPATTTGGASGGGSGGAAAGAASSANEPVVRPPPAFTPPSSSGTTPATTTTTAPTTTAPTSRAPTPPSATPPTLPQSTPTPSTPGSPIPGSTGARPIRP